MSNAMPLARPCPACGRGSRAGHRGRSALGAPTRHDPSKRCPSPPKASGTRRGRDSSATCRPRQAREQDGSGLRGHIGGGPREVLAVGRCEGLPHRPPDHRLAKAGFRRKARHPPHEQPKQPREVGGQVLLGCPARTGRDRERLRTIRLDGVAGGVSPQRLGRSDIERRVATLTPPRPRPAATPFRYLEDSAESPHAPAFTWRDVKRPR
jgi:hypothetical protein